MILSGPVGARKSTVARHLIALATKSTVFIEGYIFSSFFVHDNAGANRKKHLKVLIVSLVTAALPSATADLEVIIDF